MKRSREEEWKKPTSAVSFATRVYQKRVETVKPVEDDGGSEAFVVADVQCVLAPVVGKEKWANGFPPVEATFAVVRGGNAARPIHYEHVLFRVNVGKEVGSKQEILVDAKHQEKVTGLPTDSVSAFGFVPAESERFVTESGDFLSALQRLQEAVGVEKTLSFLTIDENAKKAIVQMFTWAKGKHMAKTGPYSVRLCSDMGLLVRPPTDNTPCATHKGKTNQTGKAFRCTKVRVDWLLGELLKLEGNLQTEGDAVYEVDGVEAKESNEHFIE